MQKKARSRYASVNDRGAVIGEDHHRARLTDHDVWLIKELHAAGVAQKEIARKFEMSKAAVSYIVRNQRRAQIATGQKRAGVTPHRYRFRLAKADEFT